MVSPTFDADGRLDLDVARTLARYLQDNGNDGLVVAGTTGETPVLTDRRASCRCSRRSIEAVTVPVIAGTRHPTTPPTPCTLTRQAEQLGVAGMLVVCPYYNRPSQAGIDAHFRAIAAATDLPVMVYDIPVRTGRKITTATMLRLFARGAEHRRAQGRCRQPGRDRRADQPRAPDGFEVYSGDDALTLPLLAVGAVGAIGVATPLERAGPSADVRRLRQGRRRRRPSASTADARELRVRDRRRRPEPDADQGDAAPPRASRSARPPADGRRPDFVEARAPQVWANLQRWRDAFPPRPDR